MPLWDWIPPYAEQVIINQVQEKLDNFKQLIPDGFVELGQPKKYWGSTEGLDKPLCERYTFKYNDKSITLDITKELSDELKLNSGNNFCVKEEVLSRSPEEGGIIINNKEEIFLRKNFTVKNLDKDIKTLFEKIEKLKEELEKEKTWWNKWVDDEKNQSGVATFLGKHFYDYAHSIGEIYPFQSWFVLKVDYFRDSDNFRAEYVAEINKGKEMIRKIYEYYRWLSD